MPNGLLHGPLLCGRDGGAVQPEKGSGVENCLREACRTRSVSPVKRNTKHVAEFSTAYPESVEGSGAVLLGSFHINNEIFVQILLLGIQDTSMRYEQILELRLIAILT